MSFISLASPYTPIDGESIEERVASAARYAAQLMTAGNAVFSPVVHSHYIADHLEGERRLDHEFWMRQDLAVLRHAALMVVLRLPGWERSRGIAREIVVAQSCNIPIQYVS